MSRNEFTKPTMREAKRRSGDRCEAYGVLYGLPAGQRCNADMNRTGFRYDHIDPDANSKDNSLENCCVCCPKCHDWKTTKRDIPMIAKTLRMQDKRNSIKKPSSWPRKPEGYKAFSRGISRAKQLDQL